MADQQYKYDAFLSYNRKADELTAPELQRLIRRVGQRWYSRATLRIFRDKTNLPLSESLQREIESALDQSRYFVLLASPGAARAPWVKIEVAYWKLTRERSNFRIVLTDGTIAWSDGDGDLDRGDFDWAKTDALPKDEMSGWFSEEPNWIDVRQPSGIQIRKGQRNERLRDAARSIAAPMYGLDKDQLDGQDERESRLARRSLQGLIAGLAIATVSAVIAATFYRVQLGVATTQTRIALVRQLVAQADVARDTDPRTALLLGIAAQHIAPAAESEMSLVNTMVDSRFASSLTGHHSDVRAVAVSPDGKTLATGSLDESVLLWDLTGDALPRRLGAPLTGHAGGVHALAFAPDGRVLAAAAGKDAVALWDVSVPREHATAWRPSGRAHRRDSRGGLQPGRSCSRDRR